jgi:hypothetical protein
VCSGLLRRQEFNLPWFSEDAQQEWSNSRAQKPGGSYIVVPTCMWFWLDRCWVINVLLHSVCVMQAIQGNIQFSGYVLFLPACHTQTPSHAIIYTSKYPTMRYAHSGVMWSVTVSYKIMISAKVRFDLLKYLELHSGSRRLRLTCRTCPASVHALFTRQKQIRTRQDDTYTWWNTMETAQEEPNQKVTR